MVAHHCLGAAGVHHGSNRANGLHLLGSAVDEVAEEEGLASQVAPGATPLPVAEVGQQGGERISMPVDVADDVVVHGADRLRRSERVVSA